MMRRLGSDGPRSGDFDLHLFASVAVLDHDLCTQRELAVGRGHLMLGIENY